MPRSSFLLCLGLFALPAAPSASLGQSAPRAASCPGPEYRQFDFWVGEWDVALPDGKPAGTNRIAPILGGCALLDRGRRHERAQLQHL